MATQSTKVLVDTSAWVEALRSNGDQKISKRIKLLFEEGQACWNEMVLLELWNGANGTEEKVMIKEMKKNVHLLSITKNVWEKANEVACSLRSQGRTVPNTDIVIYATAAHYKVSLEHNDKHFDLLHDIRL